MLSKKGRQECKVLVEEVKQKTQLDTSGGIHLPCQGFSWNDEDCPDSENSLGSLPPTFNYGNKYIKDSCNVNNLKMLHTNVKA